MPQHSIRNLNPNTPARPAPSQKAHHNPSERQTQGEIARAMRKDPNKIGTPGAGGHLAMPGKRRFSY